MTTIALLGAGGKIGYRLAHKFLCTDYEMHYLEIDPAAIQALRGIGIEVGLPAEALPGADVVILAVPDHLIGAVAAEVVPQIRPGAMVICLDAAAPYAGQLPERNDVAYFAVHPCHPPLFSDEPDPEVRADHFGGDKAPQYVVCALIQGDEQAYEIGAELARIMFAPVIDVHRVTLEQMALLEPGLVESVGATCLSAVRQALDEVVRQGVPAVAAHDFLMGHMNVTIAMLFGYIGDELSEGAQLAVRRGMEKLFKPDWLRVVSTESVRAEADSITRGAAAAPLE